MKKLVSMMLFFVVLLFSISFLEARQGVMFSQDGLIYGGPAWMRGEEWKEMRKETLALRETLNEKRFALEKELLSENPDKEKVAQLNKDINALWSELEKIREKHQIRFPRKGNFKRGNCMNWGGPCIEISKNLSEEIKNMRRETLSLREKLTQKRFLLERELLSHKPDKTKIETLEKEISDLIQELDKIREQHRAKIPYSRRSMKR